MKIVIIGDGNVGKTALRKRFMGEHFQSIYKMTIGADVSIYQLKVGHLQVKIQLWDLAGQPLFSQVRSTYYSGTIGCLVVFDVTRKETFEQVPFWIKEALKHSKNYNFPIILLGNKVDLRDEMPSALTSKHGQVLASEICKIPRKEALQCLYMDTSAKTGENVDKAFLELAKLILEKEEQSYKLPFPMRSINV
ncbi:MAG: GTP-binding protein [Candidatus Hodarchaeales archaeon]|jgi:small GTP-binding protein